MGFRLDNLDNYVCKCQPEWHGTAEMGKDACRRVVAESVGVKACAFRLAHISTRTHSSAFVQSPENRNSVK